MSILHEHPTDNKVTCVSVDFKWFGEVWESYHWGEWILSFKSLNALWCSSFHLKDNSFLRRSKSGFANYEKPRKNHICRNPNLKLTTKARGCKVASQEGSPGIMLHAPRSARKCEGIDSHTPKGNSHFGSWSPSGLLNVQRAIPGVKTQWIKEFFILLESYWNEDV
jgi:hypothetical protein